MSILATAGAALGGRVLTGVAGQIVKPLAKTLGERFGGRRGGAIAGQIVEAVADQISGVDATPIADRSDAVVLAQIEAYVDQNIAEIEVLARTMEGYHETLLADAKGDLIQRMWRPLNGILFALECLSLVWSFCYLMVSGQVETIQQAATAYGFLGTVLGTHAGVVGYYVHARRKEKEAGVS